MKRLGHFLIALGFLAGALCAVVDEETLPWGYFFLSLFVGVAGVGLVRVGERRMVRTEAVLTTNLEQLEKNLDRIVRHIRQLNAEKTAHDPYEVRNLIDERLRTDLAQFAEARESIAHVYGLQSYADVMSHFAAGERYLNRVWSASADGYIDEVHLYLDRTEEQFLLTQEQFERVKKSGEASDMATAPTHRPGTDAPGGETVNL